MIYISKFRKDIFPLYVPPLQEELFSSWMFRLAASHKIDYYEFLQKYLNFKSQTSKYDIDAAPTTEIIEILTHRTPIKKGTLENLFLTSFGSHILPINSRLGVSKSIHFLKLIKQKQKINGIPCCPKCLSMGIPYIKRKWKLTTSIICLECKTYLIDECPSCQRKITFWRSNQEEINPDTNNLIRKCKCRFDLSNYFSPLSPSALEIEYQEYIDTTILNGFNHHTQYSFTYLDTLMFTAFMLKRILKSPKHKKQLLKIYPELIVDVKVPMDKWDLAHRKQLLPIAFYLLENFPNQTKNIFPKEIILRKEIKLPYWFEKELIFKIKN